ncbi:unnamed protein product [Leptidea sinapis]|uniref:Uncharacterized protein n=1 Tax=Leptidea sinapis TaxID=189913 RepID=A0A5E4R7P3_9NEOP|nr:unnamed protein product [Leptidea sinapis]
MPCWRLPTPEDGFEEENGRRKREKKGSKVYTAPVLHEIYLQVDIIFHNLRNEISLIFLRQLYLFKLHY